MIEHYNVLQKIKKDEFLIRFYKKHVNLIKYKRDFNNLMNSFKVMFRLSNNLTLNRVFLMAGSPTINLITREESTRATTYLGARTTSFSQPHKPEFNVEKRKEDSEYWVLKSNSKFADKFYFTLIDDKILIEVFNSSKITDDEDLKMFRQNKDDWSSELLFDGCNLEVYCLEDLEKVLSKILVLVG